jgi:hypothetical protein
LIENNIFQKAEKMEGEGENDKIEMMELDLTTNKDYLK